MVMLNKKTATKF